MTGEDAIHLLRAIAAADTLSHGIIGALTLVVFVVMRAMLPVKGLALLFAPGIYCGGLAGIYAARDWGFVVSSEKATNVAATGALGMIAALVVLIVLARMADAAMRIRNPLCNEQGRARL